MLLAFASRGEYVHLWRGEKKKKKKGRASARKISLSFRILFEIFIVTIFGGLQ